MLDETLEAYYSGKLTCGEWRRARLGRRYPAFPAPRAVDGTSIAIRGCSRDSRGAAH